MGDRSTAYLTVHGEFPRACLPKFAQLCEEYGLYFSDFPMPEGGVTEANLLQCNSLYAEEMNGGLLEEITCWLHERGIWYTQSWDECGGAYDAGMERYLGDEVKSVTCTTQEGPVVAYREIVKHEALVSGWAELLKDARFWENDPPDLVFTDAPSPMPEEDEIDAEPHPAAA